MDFRILGPLEVEADGQVLPIGSRLRRTRFTGHLVGERGDHAIAA